MPSPPLPSPSGGTIASTVPSQAHYEAMDDSLTQPSHPSSAPEIFATIASCGCLGRPTAFKERCCCASRKYPARSSFCRYIKDWLDSAVYRLRRWMASLRPYPPLTPVEEGLLADLTRSAAVDNALSEDSMSALLLEWWGLVTIGGSTAPDLPRDERWKSVGFQSGRPSTDFRTGPHALLCMVQAARAYGPEFREMVAGSDGYGGGASNRFHYPFAATAINVHFMLLHYLRMVDGFSPVTKESVLSSEYERKVFASAMALTAGAFEDLFTATCMAVHAHWTRMVADEEATLMDFQESLAYGLSRAANALVKANPVRDEASWHRVLRNICISFPPPAAPSLV